MLCCLGILWVVACTGDYVAEAHRQQALARSRCAGERVAGAIKNFVAIVPLYLLFPVCGPGYAFPALPGPLLAHPFLLHAAPNGVPSGHTSSALLILALLWPWKWARLFGFLFLGLTVFATLGSGQHYFFDLLCAVPYAAGVLYLTRSTLTQKAPVCAGILLRATRMAHLHLHRGAIPGRTSMVARCGCRRVSFAFPLRASAISAIYMAAAAIFLCVCLFRPASP